ncbi:hypothetical protein MASR1M50_16330 [Burkholderiales bacterium]
MRLAAAAGDSVVFGDAATTPALIAAGLGRASAVALTYLDPPSVLKALAAIRAHAPQVPVIVRTQTDRDLDKLRAAGATEVVPEGLEGALILAGHALALSGTPVRRVARLVQQQREQRYGMLRGFFPGADDDVSTDPMEEMRLGMFTVPTSMAGQSLGEVLNRLGGLRAISLRLPTGTPAMPDDAIVLQGGETVLLSGRPDALARAEHGLAA